MKTVPSGLDAHTNYLGRHCQIFDLNSTAYLLLLLRLLCWCMHADSFTLSLW